MDTFGLRNFFDWLKQKQIPPAQATREQVRAYLVELATSGRVSAAYCRGARAAIIFLYETTLKQHDKAGDLPQMKRPLQLPVVLSRDEVARILNVTHQIKPKALLITAYSAGLRVGEVVRLKVSDIDSKRMQIRITAGKGAKDRYTVLSETALSFTRLRARIQTKGLVVSGRSSHRSFIGTFRTTHLSGRQEKSRHS